MRLLFAGTPAVAVPALEALISSRHEVVAVLTRADAPAGRGRRLAPSPVRERAEAAGIPVITERPRSEGFVDRLTSLEIDCAPVVAYGEILPPEVLAVPAHGWVNLHFSLLPAWRGAAPVQRAIMAGDEVTGASTFRIEEGLDTGPVFGVATETIRPRDTAGTLLERLSVSGAGLLVASLDAIEDGHAAPLPQDSQGVSLAPKISTEDARVTWSHPAHVVDRRVRGCTPAPGAWTALPDGSRLGVGPVTPLVDGDEQADVQLAPGQVLVGKKRVLVGTGSRPVALGDVTPAGKRTMPATDWARGARLDETVRLGAEGTS